MCIKNSLFAVIAGLWLAVAGAAVASGPPPSVDVTVGDVSGLPGSVVLPSVMLDIDGFDFDSLTLDISFDPGVLTFLPSLSKVSFNGVETSFSALPFYTPGLKGFDELGQWHESYLSFSLFPVPVSGQLMLTGAFKIADSAPAGVYHIAATGWVSTDPVFEERSFDAMAAVTVVPEPETWLLWLSGVGLLLLRRPRLR